MMFFVFAAAAAQSVQPNAPPSIATVQEASVTVRISSLNGQPIDRCEITESTVPPALSLKICPLFIGKQLKAHAGGKNGQRFVTFQTLKFRIPN